MATTYPADEHMGSFVSSFVSFLANQVDCDARALAEEKSPAIIGNWTSEASIV